MDYKNLRDAEKVQQYVTNMRPVFNKRALFTDETENYRIPAEPVAGDTVTIRFRTKRNNVDAVYLVSGDEKQQMEKAETRHNFDYYETQVVVGEETFRYYFEIICGKIRCYYTMMGVTKDIQLRNQFGIVPGFKTPAWAKGAVMYQIFVDRFCNGDPSNDVVDGEYYYIGAKTEQVKDWSRFPSAMDVRAFYGGDLQGVWDKLDYLQDLGVDVIYFNPIFVSPSNHKYDIQDYDYIDPHYGKIVKDSDENFPEEDCENIHAKKYITRVTEKENLEASNAFFVDFVKEVHRRGMRVILDGVFNHCGSFNKWLDKERIYEGQDGYQKGAYVSEDSPYRSFFQFYNTQEWPYNNSYDGWWGHDTLPKLNYEDSPMLKQYIMDIGRKWVSEPYCVDGWRLDVAADLGHSNEYNHQFWKEFRKAIKEANPEALILAEHYGDASGWLQGDEWDTVMNYDAFMEPITWFLTGMEKHSDEYNEGMLNNSQAFMNAMQHHMASFYAQSLNVAMNELSNHDHSRFLTRTNHVVGRVAERGSEAAGQNVNKAVFREAVVMQMTWPGAPTLYYGDEAGVCGFTDPDSRRTYPWGQEDQELIAFHKEMIRIHKEQKPLMRGSLKFLLNDYGMIVYGRFTRHQQCVIAVNNREDGMTLEIPVWELGVSRVRKNIFERIMLTSEEGYSTKREIYESVIGIITVTLPSHSAVVIRQIPETKVQEE
ncbi:MAG: glycoside hydrolase family 13 protein [Lachnospiraceae bacterium]|jgi:alpha-glucosidase